MKSIKKSIVAMLQPESGLPAGLSPSKPAPTSSTPRHDAWPATPFFRNLQAAAATCGRVGGLATAGLLVFAALSAMAGSAAAQGSLDTTAPVLVSAYIPAGGAVIRLDYNEDLAGTWSAWPPSSVFTLTVDGTEASVGGLYSLPHFPRRLTLIPRNRLYQGQSVLLNYADPTTGDDAQAIQDLAGNDAASFTDRTVTNNSNRKLARLEGMIRFLLQLIFPRRNQGSIGSALWSYSF